VYACGVAKRTTQIQPRDRAAWRAWLDDNHATRDHVVVVFYRKATGKPSLDYDTAVEEALCFGWIDGVKHKLDDERYTYRFTPRRAGSVWSEPNKRRIAALTAAGRMHAAGLAAIAAARDSGAWHKPARAAMPAEMPAELVAALATSKRARDAYAALAPSHQRQWQRWIADAKQPATRERRATKAIAQLASGHKDPWRA
jgi:uncharacterized protein YdeI (YjbR/CyaY-like superfamily)